MPSGGGGGGSGIVDEIWNSFGYSGIIGTGIFLAVAFFSLATRLNRDFVFGVTLVVLAYYILATVIVRVDDFGSTILFLNLAAGLLTVISLTGRFEANVFSLFGTFSGSGQGAAREILGASLVIIIIHELAGLAGDTLFS